MNEERKKLCIDEYLNLIKENPNYDSAYISFAQYIHILEEEINKLTYELAKYKLAYNYSSDKEEQYGKALYEIRECINNYDVFKEFSFPLMKRDEENQVKSSIDYEFQTSIKKSLLQILDKVKRECMH